MTTRTNRASDANQRAMEFELMVQQAAERAALDDPETSDAGRSTQYPSGWWILPGAIGGLALIVAVTFGIVQRLPWWAVGGVFALTLGTGLALVVGIAFLMGPDW